MAPMTILDLGRPLGNAYVVAGGEAQLYEGGLTLNGSGWGAGVLEMRFAFPMIGKPTIAAGTFEHELKPELGRWLPEQLDVSLGAALRDRLCLVPVGQSQGRVPLVGVLELTATGLQDRQLYDIAVRTDDGWQVVARHAVYSRQTWTDFGIVHITDMHVARRIDGFRSILRAAGRHEAAARLYNWNDRFRGFVRYANYLHRIGVLDVIIATGDNYDYQFEDGDLEESGGNAAFLRDLILGDAPGPDFPEVEELHAPIFLVAGNHDYRKHPYGLVFDVHLSGWLRAAVALLPFGFVLANKDWARLSAYNGYHLAKDDAIFLANYLDGVGGTDVQNLEPDQAARMVEVSDVWTFRKYLAAEPLSYVIALGKHRIAMIDSAHDEGIVTEQLAAIAVKAGMGTEDEDAFVGGSPNCRGVDGSALHAVREALEASDPSGLFIVGLHAPLFNPPFDAYPYFLRETQRPEQPGQTHGFLGRVGLTATSGPDLLAKVEQDHPTWFPDGRYVKRVSSEDNLDHGVSRGHTEELTKLLAGVGSRRPADLVLAGHTHCYNEFRIGHAPGADELAFYMDFYTQNPANFYPTAFTKRWVMVQSGVYTVETDDTYVEVSSAALPDASPWKMPFDALEKYMIQVPPYANPLNTAPDPQTWWAAHRPLVLQTGALGPFKRTEFFTGFRVIAVKHDVIDKIHYVPTDRLEQHDYRLDWEQAIQPEPSRRHQYVEKSRPLGSPPAVGAPAVIAFPALGSYNVVYRDGDGRLHELWRKGSDVGTSDVTTLASNAMRAATEPSLYIDTVENLLVAVYCGTDGHVYSVYWSTGEVRRDALSGSVDAPRAHGKPAAYLGADGYRHAIYREDGGYLHELYWTGPNPPGHGRITPAGASTAAGDPVAYQKPSGDNVVIYRGTDGHIHALFWSTGDVGFYELTRVAGAPFAAGDPVAYYTSFDDVQQIVYRGVDGHLHELWWQANNGVGHSSLTASAADAPVPAPDKTGDPVTYYNAGSHTKHVIYRGMDSHLYELSWTPGAGAPACIDLTAYAVAPLAADKPAAFVDGAHTNHVFYRGFDGQLHEIRWSPPGAAAWNIGRLVIS